MAGKVDECIREIPRTLKIGAFDWTVVIDEGDSGLYGLARYDTSELILWSKNHTSADRVVGTALHECLHAIFENHGLGKLKRNKAAREEAIITGFESGLISLFRDNPRFVTWMRKWLR